MAWVCFIHKEIKNGLSAQYSQCDPPAKAPIAIRCKVKLNKNPPGLLLRRQHMGQYIVAVVAQTFDITAILW